MKKEKITRHLCILLLFTLSCTSEGSTQSVEDVGDGTSGVNSGQDIQTQTNTTSTTEIDIST